MPLFEYTCLDCDRTEEVLQTFSSAQEPRYCAVCGYQMTQSVSMPARTPGAWTGQGRPPEEK